MEVTSCLIMALGERHYHCAAALLPRGRNFSSCSGPLLLSLTSLQIELGSQMSFYFQPSCTLRMTTLCKEIVDKNRVEHEEGLGLEERFRIQNAHEYYGRLCKRSSHSFPLRCLSLAYSFRGRLSMQCLCSHGRMSATAYNILLPIQFILCGSVAPSLFSRVESPRSTEKRDPYPSPTSLVFIESQITRQ